MAQGKGYCVVRVGGITADLWHSVREKKGMLVTNSSSLDRMSGVVVATPPLLSLPPRRSRLRLQLQMGLFLLDAMAIVLAFALAHAFWSGKMVSISFGPMIAAFVVCYALAGTNAGVFSSEMLSSRRSSVVVAMRTVVLASSGVILLAFFLKAGEQISRMELAIGGVLSAVLVGMGRTIFHSWTERRFGGGLHSEILVLDDCAMAAPQGVYVIDAATFNLRCDLADPLMLDRIGRLLAPVDRVVIACPLERRRNWAMVLKGANIQAEIVSPDLTDVGPLGTGWFGDNATVVVASGLLDLWQRFLKRALDILLGATAIFLLAPLFLVVVIAVRLDSPGPIFFVQDRVGRGNRLFGIYKFRSMRVDGCDRIGARSTNRDDDRITRVGRIIRATSIDELPQIFNILKGEMSFVGPRPHALGSLAGDLLFWEVDERYWHRHVCKPGLTGLAQVRGYRGATHHQSDLTNRLQADLEYVSGWTIFRDISIILATLRVIVHRNAY
ncbi:sugar transferase [Sphingomonas oryzagri]